MGWTEYPIKEPFDGVSTGRPPAPRKRTLAAKRRAYERHLMRWGSHAEAAARTGIDARTARRWREDPDFEDRCAQARAIYREIVVGEAYRRVTRPDATPVWYRGRQVGHVRRFSTALLMRLLDRM